MVSPALLASRQHFPVGGKIDDGHIRQLHGMETKKWGHKEFKKAVSELQLERKNARSWAKQKVESKILDAIRQQNVNVQTFRGLCKEFKKNGSTDFAARLWNASYTTFDNKINWEILLEEEYMEMSFLGYDEPDKTENGNNMTKGCYARLFLDVKKETIKTLNRAGASSHGGTIRMKRTSKEVKEQGKFKKRAKGMTNGQFFSLAIVEDGKYPKKKMEEVKTEVSTLMYVDLYCSNSNNSLCHLGENPTGFAEKVYETKKDKTKQKSRG